MQSGDGTESLEEKMVFGIGNWEHNDFHHPHLTMMEILAITRTS